ncbi:GDSL-type esterase/lipase family protein [Treponema primitia]|uniref:GDSL-type esterase/lipase family protein n=1 Tax=Treponema primitia TaxID=88058 RepID=UPI0002554D5C|nr:GDSL-type esterase/lipase family protein [Treponema primitia]
MYHGQVKIILYTIIIGVISGLNFTSCDNGTTSNKEDRPLVFLGDSLTAGHGASVPGKDDKTKSYPAYLQEKINMPIINAGVSGDTTADALGRINEDVLSKNPRIVIVELGANDLFQLQFSALAEIKSNLQKIITKLKARNITIFLVKFYTEDVVKSVANSIGITNGTFQRMMIKQYDAMFNALASQNDVKLISNIWDSVWGVHMSDTIHPDTVGYEIMADNFFKAMEPYLQENYLLK